MFSPSNTLVLRLAGDLVFRDFFLLLSEAESGGGASQAKETFLTSTALSIDSSIMYVSSRSSASKTPLSRSVALLASAIVLRDKAIFKNE